nr:keratin, type I cytoskeletal 9-like [Aegilops tauschii subsp. strangulata]
MASQARGGASGRDLGVTGRPEMGDAGRGARPGERWPARAAAVQAGGKLEMRGGSSGQGRRSSTGLRGEREHEDAAGCVGGGRRGGSSGGVWRATAAASGPGTWARTGAELQVRQQDGCRWLRGSGGGGSGSST